MKAFGLVAAIALVGAANASIIVTQWDFNGPSTGEVPGGPTNPTPSIGSGTASLLGVTATFASGVASGGSSDPVNTAPPNYAWNTTGYAAQGAESGERGVQFAVERIPNFSFRMVSIFGPQFGPFDDNAIYNSYWASNPNSTYASWGSL